jgi:hypothetical protein
MIVFGVEVTLEDPSCVLVAGGAPTLVDVAAIAQLLSPLDLLLARSRSGTACTVSALLNS